MSQASRSRTGSVARRVTGALGAILLASLISLTWSAYSLRAASLEAGLLRSGYVPLLLSLGAALETQNLVSAQLNHITDARNPADSRDWIETQRRLRPLSFAGVRAAIDRGLRPRKDTARNMADELVNDLSDIERFLSSDAERFTSLYSALERGDHKAAEVAQAALLQHEIAGASRLRELVKKVERAMDELTHEAVIRERRALLLLVVLSFMTVAVGGAMVVYTRRVLAPLRHVTERAKAVAEGDLTPRRVVSSGDEIGELATTFETMVDAIAKAREGLIQAERLATVGRMAAHVTHEIRNPISAMGLNIELLQEELESLPDAHEAREMVAEIGSEIERLSALSQQYLKLARRKDPEFAPEDICLIVREILAFIRTEMDRANIEVNTNIPSDSIVASIDDGQFRQSLINLLRNAREAMPNGGTLNVAVQKIADTHAEIRIADSGEGIPAEHRSNLFDPFFTTKKQGTGLGLAITREIIVAHGGTIDCEENLPHGTTFRVVLPLAKEALEL